jgi:preprotein translocase subunit SecY
MMQIKESISPKQLLFIIHLFVLSAFFPLLFIALSYIKKNKTAKGNRSQQT